jgi:hypothetical protein
VSESLANGFGGGGATCFESDIVPLTLDSSNWKPGFTTAALRPADLIAVFGSSGCVFAAAANGAFIAETGAGFGTALASCSCAAFRRTCTVTATAIMHASAAAPAHAKCHKLNRGFLRISGILGAAAASSRGSFTVAKAVTAALCERNTTSLHRSHEAR